MKKISLLPEKYTAEPATAIVSPPENRSSRPIPKNVKKYRSKIFFKKYLIFIDYFPLEQSFFMTFLFDIKYSPSVQTVRTVRTSIE